MKPGEDDLLRFPRQRGAGTIGRLFAGRRRNLLQNQQQDQLQRDATMNIFLFVQELPEQGDNILRLTHPRVLGHRQQRFGGEAASSATTSKCSQ